MKINSTFHVFIFFMAVLTFSIPFISLAQEDQWKLEAKVAAERDADADANQVLWIGGTFLLGLAGGCVLGSVGIFGAALYEPTPPVSRLIGKSPEYVIVYTDAYREKIQHTRVRAAVLGCLGGSVVSGCFWVSRFSD